MSYNLVEAGKAVGLSKTTILKAIKRGRLSASQDEITKGWAIDPSELHRVYPLVDDSTSDNGLGAPDNRLLEEVRARLTDAQAIIKDLQDRLSSSDAERTRLTILLTDQRPQKKWWRW